MDRRKRVREILQHKEFCLGDLPIRSSLDKVISELENAIRQDRHARSQDPLIIAPPSAQTALNGLHNISGFFYFLIPCLFQKALLKLNQLPI